MMYLKKLRFLTSLRFFFIITFTIIIFFNFLDIAIFKLSRSFHGVFFQFFKELIDPLSDIFDPLNIVIICVLILVFNTNIKYTLLNKDKLKVIRNNLGFSLDKTISLFNYLSLLCKHFILSIAIAGILCNLFKYIFGVSRPKYFFLEGYDRVNFFNIEHKVSSFPSGHTQAAFTLAILIIIYSNKHALYIIVLASLMSFSRIFMSMHFPSDLIAGAYLGAVVPLILYEKIYRNEVEKIKKKYNIRFKDLIKLMYWRIFV